jgi:anti-sigma regulatory factor (Ser/Thr protein kinase)
MESLASPTRFLPPSAKSASEDSVSRFGNGSKLPLVEPFEASLPPDLSRLRGLRHQLGAWLERGGVPSDQRNAVVLAIHEAAANAIEHANGRVTVRGARDEDKLLLVVSNTGRWKDRTFIDVGRGRGLSLMRALMSNLEIHTESDRTTIRMRMDFSESSRPGGSGSDRVTT